MSKAAIGFGLAVAIVSMGALATTAAAFMISYEALRVVAVASNIKPSLARLYPVPIDGAMAVATVAVIVMKIRGGKRATWYPWGVVIAGALISLVGNGLHSAGAHGVVTLSARERFLVSCVPPIMLALSVHLIAEIVLSFVRGKPREGASVDAPASVRRTPRAFRSAAPEARRPSAPMPPASAEPAPLPSPAEPLAALPSRPAESPAEPRTSEGAASPTRRPSAVPRGGMSHEERMDEVRRMYDATGKIPSRGEVKDACHCNSTTADNFRALLKAEIEQRHSKSSGAEPAPKPAEPEPIGVPS